ncbi:MAG: multidrug efflux RND transporter permease subunit [Zoogloea sp.]|nr:multidrug efflux RND transporter permease subunit [Zoogloea sp.]
MFARFFIHRPVFAIVISLVILIAGGLSILSLPIAQYPQISPPTVTVTAFYTGADAGTVEESVASVIEREVNGAENMMYMSSKSSNDGRMQLTITFRVGTDLNQAAVDVQNRVKLAEPRLPSDVVRNGLTVKKQSPDMLLLISLTSQDPAFDELFLANYAALNVTETLSRSPGVGLVQLFNARDYAMRVWVKPDRLARLGVTAGDIAAAIREQNLQAPAGQLGAPPAPKGTDFQYSVSARGRLATEKEFEDLVLRVGEDGSVVRLRDVARIELGAKDYMAAGRQNGKPAALIGVYQLPGANALETAGAVKARLEEMKASFPPGIEAAVTYDTTLFVSASLEEVLHTLFEAMVLVLIVVFMFLQNGRATLIPMLAVPVSLVGTFAAFTVLGFSINTLTMFGLVLAIGIVVDDAIVVVEAVAHHMERGLDAIAASEKAMEEVSGPVMAIALVLTAVFVPVAFMGGITGQLYKQFALTLSISVLLSALVALTLTPALCGMMLKPIKPMGGPLGVFFAAFNRFFDRMIGGYGNSVRLLSRRATLTLLALGAVIAATAWLGKTLPGSFLPTEDQGAVMTSINLPEGASLERTGEVARQAEAVLMSTPGVQNVIAIVGFNMLDGTSTSNAATLITTLAPWDERTSPEKGIRNILMGSQARFAQIPEAVIFSFLPPPIPGLGKAGGFQFELQDRAGQDVGALAEALDTVLKAARAEPELTGLNSFFRINVPQVQVSLERDRIKRLEVPMTSVFEAMQVNLGGLYVNDFVRFGRPYRVMIQAEPGQRVGISDIGSLAVRSSRGDTVQLSTLTSAAMASGPQVISRYNLYRTAEISGQAAPGRSSGEALAAMEKATQSLPPGFGFEWTGTALEEKAAGGQQAMIFVMALVFVFLFLAAQYESWAVPFAVLFGIPVGIFGAFLAAFLAGLSNDVYVQIGLVMLVGLAAKNAILIVEFAKLQREAGKPVLEAAVEAARLRLRPIMMTSFAFILGVVPLVIASGAGAASRHSLGTAVAGGMLAASTIGLFFIPTLYYVVQSLAERFGSKPTTTAKEVP